MKFFITFALIFFTNFVFAKEDIDQWIEREKTYKDLIEENFDIKSYDTTVIQNDLGLIIILFVTVLQKEKEVYECQEYQTLDGKMKTLNMNLVCKRLTQPYTTGLDT